MKSLKVFVFSTVFIISEFYWNKTRNIDRKPRDKPMHHGYLIFDKGARIHTGEKTVSPIMVLGNTAVQSLHTAVL